MLFVSNFGSGLLHVAYTFALARPLLPADYGAYTAPASAFGILPVIDHQDRDSCRVHPDYSGIGHTRWLPDYCHAINPVRSRPLISMAGMPSRPDDGPDRDYSCLAWGSQRQSTLPTLASLSTTENVSHAFIGVTLG